MNDRMARAKMKAAMAVARGLEPARHQPHVLLDTLCQRLKLDSDSALACTLDVAPPVISKVRRQHNPLGASLLISMHLVSDMSVRELRQLYEQSLRATCLSQQQRNEKAL